MSILQRSKPPVKPTRRAPRPGRPFADGLAVGPFRLSDDEQLILDELSGDWPPAGADLDAESDPADWPDWTDAYRFVPSADDEAWAADALNRAAADFDLDLVAGSMIAPEITLGLATGAIDLF